VVPRTAVVTLIAKTCINRCMVDNQRDLVGEAFANKSGSRMTIAILHDN
jgi:hypothetical protein